MRKTKLAAFAAAVTILGPITPANAAQWAPRAIAPKTTPPLIRIHQSKPGQYHDYCVRTYKDGCHRHEGNASAATPCPDVECDSGPLIEPGLREEEPKKFEKPSGE